METKHLQSLIHSTREQLAGMYEQKAFYKKAKRYNDEEGFIDSEYYMHNQLKRLTKDISKLVAVQQSLKKELAGKIKLERAIRYINKVRSELSE